VIIHSIHCFSKEHTSMFYLAVFVLFCKGTMVTQFVEGWDFVQTLGEGAYGEYVSLFVLIYIRKYTKTLNCSKTVSNCCDHYGIW